MKKRITSLILAVVIFASVISVVTVNATTESEICVSAEAIAMLKAEEGFSSKPYWDYAQWTVGYGTKCPSDKLEEYKASGISQEDADKLLNVYIAKIQAELDKFMAKTGITLNQSQYDALFLLSYNCGTAWAYSTSGVLYKAVVKGATGNELINAFSRWCNAGGQIKTFLLRRRLSEANLYLNGVYSQKIPENFGYVLYDPCGGTVSPNVQGYHTELTAQIIPTPVCEGYTFTGWYTQRTGGTEVTVLDEVVRNGRLYAHWVDAEGNDPAVDATDGVTVTVTENNLNVRTGPGTQYSATSFVNTGDQLVITETATGGSFLWGKFAHGWICLKYTNYDAVTAPKEDESAQQETRKGTIKVNDRLRIRSGPSTGYEAVGYLTGGSKVEILEQKIVGAMVWGKIENGWISMDYVVLDPVVQEPVETPEDTTPPTTEPPETEPPTTEPTEPPTTEPPATEPETEVPAQPEQSRTGTVKVNDRLRVRSGPSTATSVVGYLVKGEKVTITEQTTSGSMTWGKTTNGWVSMDYITLDKLTTEQPDTKTVTGKVKVNDFLRVRTGPGTSYAIAGYLSPNAKVEITQQKTVSGTVWGKMAKGWISLDYIVLDATNSNSNTATAQSVKKTVTASCLRIRSAAGTNNKIVGYLYQGAKIEILETKKVGSTQWGRTTKGWLSLDYVK